MTLSEKELAELLDDWSRDERALITERRELITLRRLSSEDARGLIAALETLGWTYEIEDGSEAPVSKAQVDPEFEPYKVAGHKPEVSHDRDFVLTSQGLEDWLTQPPTHAVLEVTRLGKPFETLAVRFTPRGDDSPFEPKILDSDPRKIVREVGTHRVVPSDLSPWLLRDGSEVDIEDPATSVWAKASARKLMACLCNEVEGPATLVFKGPPSSRFELGRNNLTELSAQGFATLQECSNWAFSNPKEMETRQILLVAELSRSSPGSTAISQLFRTSGASALEGAKIAFELGLSKISADSLKALADLRKAVSDEAAKLSDSTRQLASAVSGALFGGIGLIVARLTTTSNVAVAAAVLLIGTVLSLYIAATIVSGAQFVSIQRDLRSQWRDRLYRFLPQAEYERMVTGPASRAESAFKLASWISGALAAALFLAAAFVTLPQLWGAYNHTDQPPTQPQSTAELPSPPAISNKTQSGATSSATAPERNNVTQTRSDQDGTRKPDGEGTNESPKKRRSLSVWEN